MEYFAVRRQLQLAEIRSDLNKWFFCERNPFSQMTDDKLGEYYVGTGGAIDFAARFKEAMGNDNIWYCSQYYRRNERDPQTLWEYYMKYSPLVGLKLKSKYVPAREASGLGMTG